MSEKISSTLTKILSCLIRGLGIHQTTSIYVGCPIDPASLPIDLADARGSGLSLPGGL